MEMGLSNPSDWNASSGIMGSPLEEAPSLAIPYLIIIGLAMLTGSVGNVLVIGSVFVNKHLRTVGNMFIVNLAVADLCVTGFVDPFSVIGVIYGEVWFVDRFILCEAVASICLTSCFCSLLSIGAISFNRYIHICHNHLYQSIYTFKNSFIMCVGLWVVSAVAEMPNFIGWGDHVYDHKTLSCIWDRTADLSYTLFFCTVGVAFPVVLITICYIKIFLHVRASKNKVQTGGDQMGSKDRRESVKLARTLFMIFVVFAVSWTPYAIVVGADVYDTFPAEVHSYAVVVAHTNSSLNSLLYGVTNSHFRRGYMHLLGINKCLRFRNRLRRARKARVAPSNMATEDLSPNTKLGGSVGAISTVTDDMDSSGKDFTSVVHAEKRSSSRMHLKTLDVSVANSVSALNQERTSSA